MLDGTLGGTIVCPSLSNLRAEQALLGAILVNNKAFYRVATFLKAEHFADPINGRIYQTISEFIDAGRQVDSVTLKQHYEGSGKLDEVGGTAYFAQLVVSMVGILNASEYGQAIYDLWQRRELIDLGTDVVNSAAAPAAEAGDVESLIDRAETRLMVIGATAKAADAGISLAASVAKAFEQGERVRNGGRMPVIPTGLPSLDDKIVGLDEGRLHVIAGRPGNGKTTLCSTIALNVALGRRFVLGDNRVDLEVNSKEARGVLSFVYEGTDDQYGATLLAQLADVQAKDVRFGRYDNEAAERILLARRAISEAPFESFHGAYTLRQIARIARMRKRKSKVPLGLIVVDYLQLMPDHPRMEKRLSVGENIYGLKRLAMELGVPIIAASQLSRAVDQRPDKRPMESDLRETSQIEDAADVIIMLYREGHYVFKDRPQYDHNLSESANRQRLDEWQARFDAVKNNVELIIPKVRLAEAPTFVLQKFNGPFLRVEEWPRPFPAQ